MVVDLSMPGMSGIELMQRAHQLRPEVLIIILTGHATLESAIAAVRSEAADYLVKPVSGHQLLGALSRILQQRALRQHRQQLVRGIAQAVLALRRSGSQSAPQPDAESAAERIRHVPPLTLDTQRRQVMLNDEQGITRLVELSEGEAAVLTALMNKPGQVLSCGQLTQAAWNYTPDEASAQNMIRPIISRLRHKLETDLPRCRLIRTVRGRGYTLSSH
jgi:DNA-binding response OmpR family regulator